MQKNVKSYSHLHLPISLMEAGAAAHGELGCGWPEEPRDGNCWALEMLPVKGVAAATVWLTGVGAVVTLDSIACTVVGS